MMKKLIMAGIAMMTIAISSCDEDTTTMGNSLTNEADHFTSSVDTFAVSTRSIVADSVLSRSAYSYLGRIKDPETGAYITCDFMTQFMSLEKEASRIFAPADSVVEHDAEGLPIADSCHVNIIVDSYQGDTLTAMKIKLMELGKPVEENVTYYTSFDPEASGYIRNNGLVQNKVYSLSNLQQSDSVRNTQQAGTSYFNIRIPLTQQYTDQQGNSYNNYGTYLMRSYYNHPEYFKNSYTFTHNVCPGFYIKTVDGLGLLTEVMSTQLVVYYHVKIDGVYYHASKIFNGTEEVLQTTHIANDKGNIERLVNDDECTYLKTPAGIFTEVTLPVEDIKKGHESDTLMSAKIVFNRLNDTSSLSDVILEEPANLLMVQKDSLYAFFENNKLTDNITTYLATYSSQNNTYSYNNIASLINVMWNQRSSGSPNWNKVVLIPVTTVTTSSTSSSYYYSSSSSSTISAITNEMSLTSVRLVGGSANKRKPVQISIIYSKPKY